MNLIQIRFLLITFFIYCPQQLEKGADYMLIAPYDLIVGCAPILLKERIRVRVQQDGLSMSINSMHFRKQFYGPKLDVNKDAPAADRESTDWLLLGNVFLLYESRYKNDYGITMESMRFDFSSSCKFTFNRISWNYCDKQYQSFEGKCERTMQ